MFNCKNTWREISCKPDDRTAIDRTLVHCPEESAQPALQGSVLGLEQGWAWERRLGEESFGDVEC